VSDIAALFMWRRRHVVVVAITGEIDLSNARELEAAIAAELDGSPLVIDLGGLEFLDAAGVHLLHRLAARASGFALVVGEDSPPRRVLDLTGEHRLYATEEEALAGVAHPRGDAGDRGEQR
jgi:anti-anti-sigma factor